MTECSCYNVHCTGFLPELDIFVIHAIVLWSPNNSIIILISRGPVDIPPNLNFTIPDYYYYYYYYCGKATKTNLSQRWLDAFMMSQLSRALF
jgi:hypothetical protein